MRLLLALSLLSLSVASTDIALRCFYYFPSDFMIYNLRDLNDKTSHVLSATGGSITFNMCQPQTLPPACTGKFPSAYAYFLSADEKDCALVFSATFGDNASKIKDETNPDKGFTVQTKGSQYKIDVICDSNAQTPTYSIAGDTITVASQDSCGRVNEAARFIDQHRFIVSILFLVLGFLLMFFGGYKWETFIGVATFIMTFTSILFLFWALVKFKQTTGSYVIIFAIALIISIFMAYLSQVFAPLSYIAFGFFAGFFLCKILLTTLQPSFEDWLFVLLEFAVGIGLAIFCGVINKMTMVVVTGIVGSFMFFYAFGFLIGVLGNLLDVWERFASGVRLEAVYYVFFGLAVVFGLLGIMFQYSKLKQQAEQKQNDHVYGEQLYQAV